MHYRRVNAMLFLRWIIFPNFVSLVVDKALLPYAAFPSLAPLFFPAPALSFNARSREDNCIKNKMLPRTDVLK
jgi:hypothetical protein